MTYKECLDFLFSQLPMYQKIGVKALKFDLGNITHLCESLGSPHLQFKSIHVAGTNGKGSTCHALAAVLQIAGYKTGLYTSPHLKDYRERIKINGIIIEKEAVVNFVNLNIHLIRELKPSFFEITVAMAFDHFARSKVDIAVIEVGLGGRLDSTNIITPLLSLITNIGYDHEATLGNTLGAIAREKAGIIKPAVPLVVGERHSETEQLFMDNAESLKSPLYFAHDRFKVRVLSSTPVLLMEIYDQGDLLWDDFIVDLNGPYQTQNIPGILQALAILVDEGFKITHQHIRQALAAISKTTGLKGRWQLIGKSPTVICDTGHNKAAMEYIVSHLLNLNKGQLHMIMGFVNDKDIKGMLQILPKNAKYYFCAAGALRSLDPETLRLQALDCGLRGIAIEDPNKALRAAREKASPEDTIFVGGSTFVVAELDGI